MIDFSKSAYCFNNILIVGGEEWLHIARSKAKDTWSYKRTKRGRKQQLKLTICFLLSGKADEPEIWRTSFWFSIKIQGLLLHLEVTHSTLGEAHMNMTRNWSLLPAASLEVGPPHWSSLHSHLSSLSPLFSPLPLLSVSQPCWFCSQLFNRPSFFL